MTAMFSTNKEVRQLTGYDRPSAQSRWLEQAGLQYLRGGDGKLKVLRLAVEQKLGTTPADRLNREPKL